MATFHSFPRLPWELPAQIWEMAVESRNVFVIVASNLHNPEVYKHYPKFELWGPRIYKHGTPVPAVPHVCQEARNHFQRQEIYEQAFNITPSTSETPDSGLYKDWDGDKIQRLQINIRTIRFEYFESTFLLDSFPNVRELYIDCRIGDVENRDYHYEELEKLVGAENVWLIPHPRVDPGIFKTTITLARMRPELHEYWRREEEERERSGVGNTVDQVLSETSVPDGE